MDDYKKSLQSDLKKTQDYYSKSIIKTEQQKMLKKILENDDNIMISDIACGGGTLSYHLSQIKKKSNFGWYVNELENYGDRSLNVK